MSKKIKNKESQVINDFGDEWGQYNQNELKDSELKDLFNNYFKIFPFELINKNSIGFDMGCGSGRWAQLMAPKVKTLNCIEPSKKALEVAKKNLKKQKNCQYFNESVFSNSIKDNSQDFGYCLGVLHHTSDTQEGLNSCVKKLKKDAPFLLYLYYRFDNKPLWYQIIWKISNFFRIFISKMPFKIKLYITKLIALTIYWPLAKTSSLIEKLSFRVENIPLSSYSNTSFYTMRTDALDRFGTRLENRFTQSEIFEMMKNSGLTDIKFSKKIPYWVAVGIKN